MNMSTANTEKGIQTTIFASTLRKIFTPKSATITEKETPTTNKTKTGTKSSTFTHTSPKSIKATTTLTPTAKSNISIPVSTESVLPTTGLKIQPCKVYSENKNITDDKGCSSTQPARQTACKGFCNSRAVANVVSPILHVDCFCCKPMNLSSTSVPMKCPDGGRKVLKYVIITECSCDSCESKTHEAKLRTVVGAMLGNVTNSDALN